MQITGVLHVRHVEGVMIAAYVEEERLVLDAVVAQQCRVGVPLLWNLARTHPVLLLAVRQVAGGQHRARLHHNASLKGQCHEIGCFGIMSYSEAALDEKIAKVLQAILNFGIFYY